MKTILFGLIIFFSLTACDKDECQTCTKTIGGVAGTFTDEIREVCDPDEATTLENSSSGTTVWTCE